MENEAIVQSAALILGLSAISASVAMLPAVATGISEGLAAGKAAEAVARQPEAKGEITSTMLVGCALTETSGIYGFIIALLLLFVNPFFTAFESFVATLK